MPRRDDIHKILLIGSGPIVIGQAAEFDYSGTQACRVLMQEGYEVVLVNSNPATIMTDPEVATATYVEPLLPRTVAQVIEREQPDALLPTLGGQTALNLAKALHEDGTLAAHGVELIGADYEAIDRAEDRERFRETMTEAGLRVPQECDRALRRRRPCGSRRRRPAVHHPARLHARRPRRGGRPHGGRHRADGRRRDRGLADRPGADRGVGARLGRVRARGDARSHRQRRDRVLDREPRPDGGPHRRQRVRRSPADADRPPVPGAARPGDRGHPRRRGRDRRLERPVRGQPRDRRDRRHRDEPTRLALERARLQGDRLSDCQDRGPARGRLHAAGDPQRHHPGDPGELRARDRLLRREVAALRLREVPRCRGRADDAHEVGGGGDGDRADVQAGVRQGAALTRARYDGAVSRGRRGAPRARRARGCRTLRLPARGAAARRRHR